jgi:hypothetical protein
VIVWLLVLAAVAPPVLGAWTYVMVGVVNDAFAPQPDLPPRARRWRRPR